MLHLASKDIHAFLFDLDGVFYIGKEAIPGAPQVINYLRQYEVPCRFTTNTTTRGIDTLHGELQSMGLPVTKRDIFTAPQAAVKYLRQQGSPSVHLVLNENTSQEFAEFQRNDKSPDVIVIGDIGNGWNYDLMNRLFNMVMNGSRIVALHKGRYWQVADGLRMDIGAFIAGLEYTTSKTATVIGKPSSEFFRLALDDLGCKAEQVAMVGDDLYNDIEGAQNAGMAGILVKTGKYREEVTMSSQVKPDLIIGSIAELPALLG